MKRVTPLKTGAVLNVSEIAERIARRTVYHYWNKMGWDISHRIPDLREEAYSGIALSVASGESDVKALAQAGYREAQKFLRHGSRETVSLTHYSETALARDIAVEDEHWGPAALRVQRARIAQRARQLRRAARTARAVAPSNKGGRADMALRSDLRLIRRAVRYLVDGQLAGETFSFREATPHRTPAKSKLSQLYTQYARFQTRVLARLAPAT